MLCERAVSCRSCKLFYNKVKNIYVKAHAPLALFLNVFFFIIFSISVLLHTFEVEDRLSPYTTLPVCCCAGTEWLNTRIPDDSKFNLCMYTATNTQQQNVSVYMYTKCTRYTIADGGEVNHQMWISRLCHFSWMKSIYFNYSN